MFSDDRAPTLENQGMQSWKRGAGGPKGEYKGGSAACSAQVALSALLQISAYFVHAEAAGLVALLSCLLLVRALALPLPLRALLRPLQSVVARLYSLLSRSAAPSMRGAHGKNGGVSVRKSQLVSWYSLAALAELWPIAILRPVQHGGGAVAASDISCESEPLVQHG